MQIRTPRALVAAAALALLAGACTDVPTTPGAAAPGSRASLATSSSGPRLVANGVRYRDTGGKPATGRSGNAELVAEALLAKNGTATLEYTSQHVTDWWQGPGLITRVQTKALAPDGKLKFIDNFHSPSGYHGRVVQYPGLSRGDRLQLQANVHGIDPHRVDVVSVTETVKLLPDLRVEVTAPSQVEAHTPVNILAAISEHNGDVGSDAICELYVDGALADWAYNVWVDAGDAVTCAFTWSFQAGGTYPVEVRVHAPEHGDWEPADNADTVTIEVGSGTTQFYHSANFTQSITESHIIYTGSWRDTNSGQANESRSEYHNQSRQQIAYLYAFTPRPFPGPVDLRVSMSTGGRQLHAAEWTAGSEEGSWCTDHGEGRVMFWMCADNDPAWAYTQFSYTRFAGSVTYHSLGYSRTWDELTGTDLYVYHWNEETSWDDGLVELGEDWTYDVRLRNGEEEIVVAPRLRLSNQGVSEMIFPLDCTTWDQPEWGYTSTRCSESSYRSEYTYGYEY